MPLAEADLRAFERSAAENARFWSRFERVPDLRGRTVLEIGCGRGRLALDMALAGAERVLALDILPELVAFAETNVRENQPRFIDRVEFRVADLPSLDGEEKFDLIVSKDSLEHVLDLEGMLRAMRRRLRPGGEIYLGFGPLYTSPFGDHDRRARAFDAWGPLGRMIAALPWGHLWLEQSVVRRHAARTGRAVASMKDLGLNGLGISHYRAAFSAAGLRLESQRLNQGPRLASALLSLFARSRRLEDYFVFNTYCILKDAGMAEVVALVPPPPPTPPGETPQRDVAS